jgi:hypothetical protein
MHAAADLGGVPTAVDLRGARDIGSLEAHAPEWCPLASYSRRQRAAFPRRERWWIDDPVYMRFCIHIYVNINRFL